MRFIPARFTADLNPPSTTKGIQYTLGANDLDRLNREGDEGSPADATIFGLTPTSDINPAFRTAVKRAGLNLTLHDLRRVYLNRLRENGVSLETAMALTGHRSVATVMKYYREVSQQDLAGASTSSFG